MRTSRMALEGVADVTWVRERVTRADDAADGKTGEVAGALAGGGVALGVEGALPDGPAGGPAMGLARSPRARASAAVLLTAE